MTVIDEILEANEIYARTHELRPLTPRPARKLAILTCMDTRLSIRTMGLKTGDAPLFATREASSPTTPCVPCSSRTTCWVLRNS